MTEEEDPVLHASTYESDVAVLKMRPDLSAELPRRLVKIGYKAQSGVVLSRLEGLVAMWHAAGRSAVVEGVHLHLKAVVRLMQQYPSIMPFLVQPLPLPRCAHSAPVATGARALPDTGLCMCCGPFAAPHFTEHLALYLHTNPMHLSK